MDQTWICPICLFDAQAFPRVQDLATHVADDHVEWLDGCRIPPSPA